MNLRNLNIDKSWTLFLDRDGVINQRIIGGYVSKVNEFIFLSGAEKAIVDLSKIFGRIIIVTNQQGIGKGIMTHANLKIVHQHLLVSITTLGGNIDAIYYAPQLSSEKSKMRKPNTGMIEKAMKDFPDILLNKSIVVGDSHSDMKLGINAGTQIVYIGKSDIYENCFNSLIDFRNHLKQRVA